MPPPYCYDYPRPSVTVDAVVFALRRQSLQVLLIRRKHDPFAGHWALPGGFLEIDEPIETGARRELKEETGLATKAPFSFLGVYGAPGRDPRGRTISIAHLTLWPGTPPAPSGQDDASDAGWSDAFKTLEYEPLAFDHSAILGDGLAALQKLAHDDPARLLAWLPKTFDQARLERLAESIQLEKAVAKSLGKRLVASRVIAEDTEHGFRKVKLGE